jgi:hypothetical protein
MLHDVIEVVMWWPTIFFMGFMIGRAFRTRRR